MADDGYVNIVGGSRTWSSAAGKTSTRARSRSSFTGTPISSTRKSSASLTCVSGGGPARLDRLRPGTQLDADQVRDYCKGKIAHYKVPRYIRFTSDFPMTVTGKIQKFKMRQTSTTELGLQEASQIRTA